MRSIRFVLLVLLCLSSAAQASEPDQLATHDRDMAEQASIDHAIIWMSAFGVDMDINAAECDAMHFRYACEVFANHYTSPQYLAGNIAVIRANSAKLDGDIKLADAEQAGLLAFTALQGGQQAFGDGLWSLASTKFVEATSRYIASENKHLTVIKARQAAIDHFDDARSKYMDAITELQMGGM